MTDDARTEDGAPVGWHFDGRSATRHAVRVVPGAEGFVLVGDGVDAGPRRWSELVAMDGTRGRSVYGLKGVSGWRLIFDGRPPEAFAVHLPLPARYGRWVDRFGLTRAAIGFTLIAAVVVAAILTAPTWIAPLVPRSVENRLGDAMVGDLGGRFCRTPPGRAALDRLAATLGAKEAGVRSVEVANIDMVNAVALPGGRIMIFRGLLKQAASADEVAGVLAHEIGHVRHRDTMAALIRQLGLSVILGGADGNIAGLLNGVLSLSYGRDAERAADGYAIERLSAASIAPDGTAAFFDRLGKGKQGESLERATSWISSHPVSADRKAAFLKSRRPGATYRPALAAADWQALKEICAKDRDVAPAPSFEW
ncbi:MAG TPA: M48 family metallopeptidase [Sphingobium sp.]